MSNLKKAIKAVAKGKITEFKQAIVAELYRRAADEIDGRRIAVAQSIFESGASPREKKFAAMHWDKMDKPFDAADGSGKPTGISKAPKRPADGDEDGYVDPFEDTDYGKDPWGKA